MIMNNPQRINNILGWLVFLIASAVYIITCEPTASYWDPGEYIATAYKLQVGHPPGAPFFQLTGRLFSLLAFGNTELVAYMVNVMSALLSGATIMFLFWTITALARKLFDVNGEGATGANMLAVWAAGLVGAFAYTFSDSFWFSAVEGEVYAMSSFFTAVVFWAILKWEAVADEVQSLRWIILIAFLVGLSIGVHLLNLLAIPAITFVVYFRKYQPSARGLVIAFVVSILLLAAVMYGIIPQIVALFAGTELLFVNFFGLPFHSGIVFLALLIIALIILGLRYTYHPVRAHTIAVIALSAILIALIVASGSTALQIVVRLLCCAALAVLVYLVRRNHNLLKTAILSLAFILIGYSTFLILVIRSNAEPPINENSPKDAISLLSYLNREQYGTWPLVYGQYFNAPLDNKEPFVDGTPVYVRDPAAGKYVIADEAKQSAPNYDDRFCTFFPRMWSSQQSYHETGYRSWGQIKGNPVHVTNYYGKQEIVTKPTFLENIRFFFSYQLGHMYFRYFMWNFAGKQNDLQGYGGSQKGNWISGIVVLDEWRLGPQRDLPDHMAGNKGRNTFYLLPLILGLTGFLFHLNKRSKDAFVVFLLFVFTGIAINVYLNIVPYQPRERDYAYAASFYAFAIWIGMGVIPLSNLLRKWFRPKVAVIIPALLCLLLVPGIMAKEGWDDHDRSGRYTAAHMAKNYLNSCAPDAILFTLGDNDTFPLWYVQEVEGVRRDVRVVNLSLLNADWYIEQMKRRAYESAPLPLSIPLEKFIASKRELVYLYKDGSLPEGTDYLSLEQAVAMAVSDDPRHKLTTFRGEQNYIPTPNFYIPVDSAGVIGSGLVPPAYYDSVEHRLAWTYPEFAIQKNTLIIFDLLANFRWERPVYVAVTAGEDALMGIQDHWRLEGLAYRLVPYRYKSIDQEPGRVDTDIMFANMMHAFGWGNMQNPRVYLDEVNRRMAATLRNLFARLAGALLHENKADSAALVCEKCMEVMPHASIPFDGTMIPLAEILFATGKTEKALEICDVLVERCAQEFAYYSRFRGIEAVYIGSDRKETAEMAIAVREIAERFGQKELVERVKKLLAMYAIKEADL